MSDEEFETELAALLEKFPEKARTGFSVEASEAASSATASGTSDPIDAAMARKKRCVKYIYIPGQGMKCVKWE